MGFEFGRVPVGVEADHPVQRAGFYLCLGRDFDPEALRMTAQKGQTPSTNDRDLCGIHRLSERGCFAIGEGPTGPDILFYSQRLRELLGEGQSIHRGR